MNLQYLMPAAMKTTINFDGAMDGGKNRVEQCLKVGVQRAFRLSNRNR